MTRLVHPAQRDALSTESAYDAGVWGVFASHQPGGQTGARWVLPGATELQQAANQVGAESESTETADAA